MRRFHSYGPVDCERHFCVPRRELVEACLRHLVDDVDKGGHYSFSEIKFPQFSNEFASVGWVEHSETQRTGGDHDSPPKLLGYAYMLDLNTFQSSQSD